MMVAVYEPIYYDTKKYRIFFRLRGGITHEDISVEFTENKMSQYECINHKVHFRDDNGDIVLIKGADNHLVVFYQGQTFIRARQWEYDKWMAKKYPGTVNAEVYNRMLQFSLTSDA